MPNWSELIMEILEDPDRETQEEGGSCRDSWILGSGKVERERVCYLFFHCLLDKQVCTPVFDYWIFINNKNYLRQILLMISTCDMKHCNFSMLQRASGFSHHSLLLSQPPLDPWAVTKSTCHREPICTTMPAIHRPQYQIQFNHSLSTLEKFIHRAIKRLMSTDKNYIAVDDRIATVDKTKVSGQTIKQVF